MEQKTTPGNQPVLTVEDYFKLLAPADRELLQHVRDLVKREVLGVRERIAYGVVVFSLKRYLVGIAAQAKYCSFYVMSPALVRTMANALKGYAVSGATIHFTPREPLPDPLIKDILRRRLAEMTGRV